MDTPILQSSPETIPLQRDDILRILHEHKPAFAEQYGVTALGIFGSVARGDVTSESDVDIVVRMHEPRLYWMVHIKDTLEQALRCHVDIVPYSEHMNAFLKSRIDRDALYV